MNRSRSYSHWGGGGGPRQGSYCPMGALGGRREQFYPPAHHWVLMSHALLSLLPPPPLQPISSLPSSSTTLGSCWPQATRVAELSSSSENQRCGGAWWEGGLLSLGFNPQGATRSTPPGCLGWKERVSWHAGMGPGRSQGGNPPGQLKAPYSEPPLLSGHCVLDPRETDS